MKGGPSAGDIEYSTFGEYEDGEEGEYSYTGKQRDSGTGLTYFNARYYDAAIGRFVSVDPIKSGANWYVYCENNPLRYTDSTGLFTNADTESINKLLQETIDNSKNLGPYAGPVILLVVLSVLLQGDAMPAVATPPGFYDTGGGMVWSPDTGFISIGEAWDTYSKYAERGRADNVNDSFDDALNNAINNAGDLGKNTLQMYDPVTGTLIGESSKNGKRGWRIDKDHINWWDWSLGKKGKGGRYGHEFHPSDQTGPHSKCIGYANFVENHNYTPEQHPGK